MSGHGRPESGAPLVRRLIVGVSALRTFVRRHPELCVVGAITVVGLAFRLARIGYGYPYSYYWDEAYNLRPTIDYMTKGDFNPHFFAYGGFLSYAQLLVDIPYFFLAVGRGTIDGIQDVALIPGPGNQAWNVLPPQLLLTGRLLSAVLTSAAVPVVYLLARRLVSRPVSVVAALVLATMPAHVRHSGVILVDGIAAFWAVLALLLAVIAAERADRRSAVIAGLAAGVAMGTKLNTAPVALVALSLVLLSAPRRWERVGIAALAVPAGFLIFNPYALLALDEFLRDIGTVLFQYRNHIGTPFAGEPGWPAVAHFLRWLASGIGLGMPLTVLMLVGLLLGLRWRTRATLIAAAYPLLLLLEMQSSEAPVRGFVSGAPFYAILAAIGVELLSLGLLEAVKRARRPGRVPAANLLRASLLCVGLVGALLNLLPDTLSTLRWRDTRVQVLDWIESNVPAGEKIAVQDSIHFQPADLERLPYEFVTIRMEDLATARESGARYLITTYAMRRWSIGEDGLLSGDAFFRGYVDARRFSPVACFWNDTEIRDFYWDGDEMAFTRLETLGAAQDSVIVSPPLQVRAVDAAAHAAVDDCSAGNPFSLLVRQVFESNAQTALVNVAAFNIDERRIPVLFEHPPSEVSAKITVPDGAVLSGAVALSPDVWHPDAGDGVRFVLELQPAPSAARERLLDIWTDPKNNPADRAWKSFSLDLSRFSGQKVTIFLRTEPGADSRADSAGWAGLELKPVD